MLWSDATQRRRPDGPRTTPPTTVDGRATEGQDVRPAGTREPSRGALPDGVVAGISHRVVVLRRGVPDDDLRRSPPRALPRRRGGAHACPQVVEGRRRAVRRRCGVGHDPELRDGPAVARHDGDVRRRDRPAVRARGHRVLRRGGVHRHLPVRVGPPPAQGAPAHADPDHRVRLVRHVLHPCRQLVDERAERLPSRRGCVGHIAGDRRGSAGGDLQPCSVAAVHPHVRRHVPRDRVPRRQRVCRGDLAGAPRPRSPARLHRAVRVRHGGGAPPARHRPRRGNAPRHRPAVEAGGDGAQRRNRDELAAHHRRRADRRRGARWVRDPRCRVGPGPRARPTVPCPA